MKVILRRFSDFPGQKNNLEYVPVQALGILDNVNTSFVAYIIIGFDVYTLVHYKLSWDDLAIPQCSASLSGELLLYLFRKSILEWCAVQVILEGYLQAREVTAD